MENKELLAKEWLEWLDKQPKETFDKDTENVKFYYNLIANEDSLENDEKTKTFVESQFATSLMFKRIKFCHNYSATLSVILWISTVCESPGNIVVYCNYFQYKCFNDGINKVDMKVLSRWFFNGFFSTETLAEAWQRQKLGEGNLVDLGIIPNLYNTNEGHR